MAELSDLSNLPSEAEYVGKPHKMDSQSTNESYVVFPLQTEHSVEDAKRFGEIVYVFDEQTTPFKAEEFCKAIHEFLDSEIGFDPKMDYIGLTGGTIQVSILLAVALKKYKRVRVLMFEAQSGVYMERMVE